MKLLDQEVDPVIVGLLRVAIGTAVVMKVVQIARAVPLRIDQDVLRLPYVEWLPLPPLEPFIGLWLVAALAFAAGFKTRWSGLAVCGFAAYWLFLDQQLYLNHLYFLLLLCILLTVADSGAQVSLDAREKGGATAVPYWPVFLIKLQVSLMYGFAALAKLNPDYLSGDVLNSVVDLPVVGEAPALLISLAAHISIGTEIFLALGLWVKRLLWGVFALGVVFHTAMALVIGPANPLAVFAVASLSPYMLFGDKARPRAPLAHQVTAGQELAAI